MSHTITSNPSITFTPSEHPYEGTIPVKTLPTTEENGDTINSRPPIVVWLPNHLFVENYLFLRDVKFALSKRTYLQVLMTLSQCIKNLHWCHDPKENILYHDDTAVLAKDEYFVDDHGDSRPRTEQILEYVHSTQNVRLGVRIWIFSIDPNINLGAGIKQLIANNQFDEQEKEKKSRRGIRIRPSTREPWETFFDLTDIDVWAFGACDAYRRSGRCLDDVGMVKHPKFDVSYETNPCNPYKVFSPEFAFNDCRAELLSAFPEQRNFASYVVNGNVGSPEAYCFPRPELTFCINRSWFHPALLYSVPLPNVCMEPLRQQNISELAAQMKFSPSVISLFLQRDMQDIQENEKNMGAFHVLAERNRILRKAMVPVSLVVPFERFNARQAYNRAALEGFIKIWSVDANISRICKIMIRWQQDRRTRKAECGLEHTMSTPTYQWDRQLSVFGNRMVELVTSFEKFLQLSTIHRPLLSTYIFRYDAYRRSLGLHTNGVWAGEGSTGKSYGFDCIEAMSIPDTTEAVSYTTAKADCVEDNDNDTIKIMHEAPPDLMGLDPKQMSDTGNPILKDKLASGKVKTKYFKFNEKTGKRENGYSVSEQIGVYFMATNDPPHKIAPAMAQRFWVTAFPKISRKGREVKELMGAPMSVEDQFLKREFLEKCHIEQYLVNLAEKMIWTGVLEAPNLNICDKYFNNILDNLYNKGIGQAKEARDFTRLRNTARSLTIMNAINIVFNHTPTYRNQPFHLGMMLAIEPHLVCTEEIAFFVMSLSEDMYVNPILPDVVKIFAQMAKYENPVGAKPNNHPDPKDTQDYDFNYVEYEMDGGGNGLPALSHRIKSEMSGSVASPNNILHLLKQLYGSSIEFAQRNELQLELPNSKKNMALLRVDTGNRYPRFAMSTAFIDMVLNPDNKYTDIMRTCIQESFHKFIRPRKIITGESFLHDKLLPQYLKTMDLVPNPHVVMSLLNTNYSTDAETAVFHGKHYTEQPMYFVNEDYECLEFMRHWQRCGYLGGMEDFFPHNVERLVSAAKTYKHLVDKRYPEDYIRATQSALAIQRTMNENVAAKIQQGTYNLSNQVSGYKRKR